MIKGKSVILSYLTPQTSTLALGSLIDLQSCIIVCTAMYVYSCALIQKEKTNLPCTDFWSIVFGFDHWEGGGGKKKFFFFNI